MKTRTHYDNLKIDRSASQDEIKRAYRKLCAIHHPDKHSPENRERQNKIITIINEAYKVLSDETLKNEHDTWILSQGQAQTQTQTQDENIHTDFNFTNVKVKTMPAIELIFVILLSMILLLTGLMLEHAFKPKNTAKDYGEDLSNVFATAFNQGAKKIHLPIKVDAITSLISFSATGYKINYRYAVNAASSEVRFNKIESNAYGKFKGNKMCNTYELRQLPIFISLSYHFSVDEGNKSFIKPLAYLCGD